MCHWYAYYLQICPYIYPQNTAGIRATATFPKRAALEALLGMNFVCHLLFPLCMYRSTHDFRLTFCTFLCFSWKCASCSSGEHGREGCFYTNIWKLLHLASMETENVQLWGVKSPCGRPCCVQNLVAIAERAAMAPLGCKFCMQSVFPFVLFLFNTPFLITFLKNASRCNGKHVFVKQLQAFCIRKSTCLTPKFPW